MERTSSRPGGSCTRCSPAPFTVVIQRMLRHSKDMTMHYVHAKAREAQEQYITELGIAADANSDRGAHCGSSKIADHVEVL